MAVRLRKQATVDKHFWNFGLTKRSQALQPTGLFKTLFTGSNESVLAAVALDGHSILTCHIDGTIRKTEVRGTTQTLNPGSREESIWIHSDTSRIADATFHENDCYMLDSLSGSIWSVDPLGLRSDRIELDCEHLEQWARLVIVRTDDPTTTIAIVGPTKTGRFVVRAISGDAERKAGTLERPLNNFRELTAVSSDFAFAVDWPSSTLLLWDAGRNRLLSHSWLTGNTREECEIEETSRPRSGRQGLKSQGRTSMAVYPLSVIDLDVFHENEQDLVREAATTGFPRTLLFSGVDNASVWRWIDFGKSMRSGTLTGTRELGGLVGTNRSTTTALPGTAAIDPKFFFGTDQYPDLALSGLMHLQVADNGILSIVFGGGAGVALMIPASASKHQRFSETASEES